MDDLRVMVAHADGMQVKAAGGVKTLDACLQMMAIGVSRCGTRSSQQILEEAEKREKAGELFLVLE